MTFSISNLGMSPLMIRMMRNLSPLQILSIFSILHNIEGRYVVGRKSVDGLNQFQYVVCYHNLATSQQMDHR